MRCKTAERYISLKLDGELSTKLVSKLDEHLKKCSSCNEIYRQTALLHENLTAIQDVEYPAWLHHRIMNNLPIKTRRQSSWRLSLSYAAFSLLLFFSIFAGVGLGQKAYADSSDYAQIEEEEYLQLSFGDNSIWEVYDE